MTREIKFRAYTEISNEVLGMKYDVPHTYNDTVMQFTGLFDCNGKEIYEGDIVAFYDTTLPTEEDNRRVLECKFRDAGFGFFAKDDSITGSLNNDDKEFREIIGNIYENENLIK